MSVGGNGSAMEIYLLAKKADGTKREKFPDGSNADSFSVPERCEDGLLAIWTCMRV